MLGGSVYIAFIRFAISLAGVILLFFSMSKSRLGRKKTIVCYGVFSIIILLLTCVWYVVDWESCIRIGAFVMYMCFALLSVFVSSDSVYLCVYKLALIFYLLAVFLIGGVEVSILFFHRNIWADIFTRILLILLMTFIIEKKLKNSIEGFGDYVEKEVDKFSIAVMIISILFGIGYIMNSNIRIAAPYRLYQIATNFVLTGTLQLLMFRFYLHVGREKEFQRENQLIQMNHRLLERQVEILEESIESGARLRHDIRHHNVVIAEYIRQGQHDELLQYLEAYNKETEQCTMERICANNAVNNILTITDIDLVTILANAYENAIYACMEVKKQEERECFIQLILREKKNKLTIFCSNTCKKWMNGQKKAEFTGGIGVSSIIKTAEKYNGEYDFKDDNGIFTFRMVLNIPAAAGA